MSRPVALVGMMGSGKTSVGKILARQLAAAVCDTDAAVEESEGMTVAEIFRDKGEAEFRKIESAALKKILQTNPSGVLSAGGGIVLSAANRKLLREKTFCVYLSAAAATLAARLENDKARPLLVGGGEKKIKEILRGRRALYEQTAHIVIRQTAADKAAAVAARILKRLPR